MVSGSNLYTHIQKHIVNAARTSQAPSIWNADLDIGQNDELMMKFEDQLQIAARLTAVLRNFSGMISDMIIHGVEASPVPNDSKNASISG